MGESAPGAGDHKDAVFFSPHKFVGGPQTPGVLVVRRDLVRNRVPTVPGGGTIAFVDPVGQRYLDDPVAREEGGTPGIVESVRAGLVVALKEAATWRSRGCRSCPSASATAPATCTTSWWWRCSTTCSASRPGAAARAPPPRHRPGPVAGPERPVRPRLDRDQARLGPAQLQLLPRRPGRRLPGRGRRPAGHLRPPAPRRLPLRPPQRPPAPPGRAARPGPVPSRPARRPARARAGHRRRRPRRPAGAGPGPARGGRAGRPGGGAELAPARARAPARLPPAGYGLESAFGRRSIDSDRQVRRSGLRSQAAARAAATRPARTIPTRPLRWWTWRQPAPAA
jgi:Aminotransferase class-V